MDNSNTYGSFESLDAQQQINPLEDNCNIIDFTKRRINFYQKRDEDYYSFYLRCFANSPKTISDNLKAQQNFIMGLTTFDFLKLSDHIFYSNAISETNFVNRKRTFRQDPNESCIQFYERCCDSDSSEDKSYAKENFVLGLLPKYLKQLLKILETSKITIIDAIMRLTKTQNIECYYCSKKGHKEFQCYKKKREQVLKFNN